MKLSFFVAGLPKTSGSKRAFMPKGARFPVVVEACKGSKDWRGDVKTFAVKAMMDANNHDGSVAMTTAAVRVRFSFTFPRPKGDFGKKGLKPSAPHYHIKRPDLLKLGRAVEDALTGIVWKDDAQIVAEMLTKDYGATPGVEIVIETIEEREAVEALNEMEAV